MIRVLIADDDVYSRNNIRNYLHGERDINIIAECEDGINASEKLAILEPNILILDTELPKISGFEILESARRMRMPYVIFISSYDKYALRAFEFNAIDYLVKPLEKRRFLDAILKVRRYIERDMRAEYHAISPNKSVSNPTGSIHPMAERVPVKIGRRINLLSTSAIRYIVADRDSTNFHMVTGETIHSSERISQLETKLPADRFQRIHRSIIANLEFIREIRPKKGSYEVVINNGENFMSGHIYKRELDTLFTFWNKRLNAA